MVSDLYWEDFHVGRQFRSGEYTMTEREMVEFARKFDPQPFHTDAEAAKQSVFGGLIASGWFTAAIVMRLRTESGIRIAGGMIGMGIEELRWPRPVRAGDQLHVETEVLEVRPSRSRPQRFTATESPTETMSAPAASAMRAVGVSHATTPTILRPSRFIAWSCSTVKRGAR